MQSGTRASWLWALALGSALVARPASEAAEEPSQGADAPLKALGLTAVKTRYLFTEDEQKLADKYKEARDARDDVRQALGRIEEGEMLEQGLYQLQAQEQEMLSGISSMRAQANSMGNMGRRGRGGAYFRNQANAAVRQEEANVKQLQSQINAAKKQKPDDKAKQVDQARARLAMGRAEQVLKELNEQYDALMDRYAEARSRPGVREALEAQGLVKKVGLRLGPSEESEKIGKWVKGLLKIRPKRPSATPAKKPTAEVAPSGPSEEP